MTTALMQGAVVPLSGTQRISPLNYDTESFCGNIRSLRFPAIDSAPGLQSRNAILCRSKIIAKRIICRDVRYSSYNGDKQQSTRQVCMKKMQASGNGALEATAEDGNVAVEATDEDGNVAEGNIEITTDEDFEKQVNPEDIRFLSCVVSRYNKITVMEIGREAKHLLAGARLLVMDEPGNLHTVYYEHNILTNSYYDVLPTIVPIIPDGPVGIMGLGAGATSHILHHFFPTLEMHGWELDPEVINVARRFFNMSKLERSEETEADGLSSATSGKKFSFVDQDVASNEKLHNGPGKLTVHIGDALDPSVAVEGGFAGLIIDLFHRGRVIPALQEPITWLRLKKKLRPGGRMIVNCGGERVTAAGEQLSSPGQLYMELTLAAMNEVFPGELSTRYLAGKGFNTIAITGPSPDVAFWSQALPEPLRDGVTEWKSVS